MKKSLADKIEEYIKVLINNSGEEQIIIQRIELAETFGCVPSQVSYVLSTRFTNKSGYETESRRGGKGFVRISKQEDLDAGPARCSQKDVEQYLQVLKDEDLIDDISFSSFMLLIKNSVSKTSEDELQELLGAFYKTINLFVKY